jgi:recombination protein RecR
MQDGPLQHLIKMLSGMPGLGNRSARRIALHLLNKRESLMLPLAHVLQRAAEDIKTCDRCGNLDVLVPCTLCQDTNRNKTQICVVGQVSDLWAIERTGAYRGQYHVLGGLLSALDGIGPDQLRISELVSRAQANEIEEIILALSATVDGQSTAHYISDHLDREGLDITHLAHGVPVGGELDYLDDGTITTALRSRKAS